MIMLQDGTVANHHTAIQPRRLPIVGPSFKLEAIVMNDNYQIVLHAYS